MTPEEKQKQLNANYAEYIALRDKAAAEGKNIGSFNTWQHENGKVGIRIPKRGEE